MSYRVVLHANRKPGMTPQDFKSHYEDVHVPLVKQMSADLFPITHTRRYVSRPRESSTNPVNETNNSAETSSPSGPGYDAIIEMVFENEETFHKFSSLLAHPDNAPKIAEDCALFLDTSAPPCIAVIGDVCETRRG